MRPKKLTTFSTTVRDDSFKASLWKTCSLEEWGQGPIFSEKPLVWI